MNSVREALSLVRLLAITVVGAAFLVPVEAAAQQNIVRGQVVERGGAPIPGATVELQNFRPYPTAVDGRFRFERVAAGRYALTVQALGYTAVDTAIIVPGDSILVIEMVPAPVVLDPLTVVATSISVRGVVSDAETGRTLIDVEVQAPGDRGERTNIVGGFRFEDLPAHTPIPLTVRELGYHPQNVEVVAAEDTTIEIRLEADPIARRMIENAKVRLAERSAERTWDVVPAVTRDDLVRNINRSVSDVLREALFIRIDRVKCIIVDERVSVVNDMLLETMLPDRVEHIEILEFGFERSELMIRTYTRDYFPTVMLPGADLLSRDDLTKAARRGRCM